MINIAEILKNSIIESLEDRAGVAFSGIALIFYGFARGWQGTGDVLKFITALAVAIIFIILAVFVNQKYGKEKVK